MFLNVFKQLSTFHFFVAEYVEKPNDLKRCFFYSYLRKTLFHQVLAKVFHLII